MYIKIDAWPFLAPALAPSLVPALTDSVYGALRCSVLHCEGCVLTSFLKS